MWSESESFVNFRYLESENFRRNFKCAYATARSVVQRHQDVCIWSKKLTEKLKHI